MSRWLESYPNMYVDIDARISELGRQPYSARRSFLNIKIELCSGLTRPLIGTRTASTTGS